MGKLQMMVELDYDDQTMHGDDKEAQAWFMKEIIAGDDLKLWDTGDLGDEIGTIKVLYLAPKSPKPHHHKEET